MGEQVVVRARDELIAEDLVAYQSPLVQVLSLPQGGLQKRGGGLMQLGDIFRSLGDKTRPHSNEPGRHR
jgi:hypothetical protein